MVKKVIVESKNIWDLRNIVQGINSNDMLKGLFDGASPFKLDFIIHCPPKQEHFEHQSNVNVAPVFVVFLFFRYVTL